MGRRMRTLVTGAGGQLGIDYVAHAVARGDEVLALTRSQLDVADRDAVLGVITPWRPDVVVNAAAWTAVDAAEAEPDAAFAANALAVRWLAEGCDRVGAHLVTVSTDYVFDGTLDRPYHEWDVPSPRSVYGASKLAGEREALALGARAAVARTSWVCGAHGANMLKTVVRLAGGAAGAGPAGTPIGDDTPGRLAFVDDQRGCPTFTADLAVALRRLALDRRSGVHHVTNAGAVSWYEFVVEVLRQLGRPTEIVRPIVTADLDPPRPAPRPANSVLDNAVWSAAGLTPLRDFREPLAEALQALGA